MPAVTDIVLLVRSGCHLCEPARALVAQLCQRAGTAFREEDVDGDPDLAARYGDLVPALVIDGRLEDYWRIDPARLAARLGLDD